MARWTSCEAPELTASLERSYDLAKFHDTGDEVEHNILALRLTGSASAVSQIRLVRTGANRFDIDHERRLIKVNGKHNDPLYIVKRGASCTIELSLYNKDDIEPVVIVGKEDGADSAISLPQLAPWAEPPIDLLASRLIFHEARRASFFVISRGVLECISQAKIGHVFSENRVTYPPGARRITVTSPAGSSYFGVSLSVQAADGGDIEHKHVLYGRL